MEDVVESDETTLRVQGTMEDVSGQQSLALKVLGSRFDAYREAIHPSTSAGSFNVIVGAARVNQGVVYTDLAMVGDTSLGDQDFGTLHHGNPFPSDYTAYVSTTVTFDVNLPVPGDDVELALSTQDFELCLAEAAADGEPIAPTLSPVRNLRINDIDALNPPAHVTSSPTLSRDPPEIGTATLYRVWVNSLVKYEGEWVRGDKSVDIITDETRVPLPPGALTEGERYLVSITAISDPATHLAQPEHTSFTRATSRALSAVFMP